MAWSNTVIGGVSTPVVYRLEDNNRVVNGSIEDVLGTEWTDGSGSGYSRVAASDQSPSFVAPRGDYIMKVDDDNAAAAEYVAQYVNYGGNIGSTSWLLTGKVRASSSDHNVDIILGTSATDGGAISADATLTIPAKTDYSRSFHIVHTFSGETDDFIAIAFYGASSTVVAETGVAFFDDIRLYKINETYSLTQPIVQSGSAWEQRWIEEFVNEFDLIDGKKRRISNGWRYFLNMVYGFNLPGDEQNIIEMTESGINYVVPHSDNLFGSYVRWNGEYKNEYFLGKYLGHSSFISFQAIELERDKPRQYTQDHTLA